MRPIVLVTDISAPVERVWQALCDPDEVVRWDAGVAEALDAPPDYPYPGQTVRWLNRDPRLPVLIDRPQEVVPLRRLRSLLQLGRSCLDETYDLEATPGGCRLTTTVRAWTRASKPDTLRSARTGRAIQLGFEASLAGLKRWCEAQRRPV